MKHVQRVQQIQHVQHVLSPFLRTCVQQMQHVPSPFLPLAPPEMLADSGPYKLAPSRQHMEAGDMLYIPL
jgi:hypothetical protein